VIGGRTYYYAILMYEGGEEECYRRGDAPPLYSWFSALAADLKHDGVVVEADDGGVVDIDSALLGLSGSMSEAAMSGLLVSWNCLEELTEALGTPLRFRGGLANGAYEYLFRGLNLPGFTHSGEHFIPRWTRRRLAKIHQVIRVGASRVQRYAVGAGIAGSPPGARWDS
jgi:PAS domain-containing protein